MSTYVKKLVKKKWFTASNISTAIMLLLLITIIAIPDVKVLMLRTIMKTGLLRPDLQQGSKTRGSANESGNVNVYFLDNEKRQINVSDLRGRVVFINFWATWCPPCRAELPSIYDLHHQLGRDTSVVFLLVEVDGAADKADAMLKRHAAGLSAVIPDGPIPDQLFTGTLPTTVVLDKTGKMVLKQEGIADYGNAEFVRFMEGLMGRQRNR